jgi:hypothetical protein
MKIQSAPTSRQVDVLQHRADGVPAVLPPLQVGHQPPLPRLRRQPAAQVRLPPRALHQVVLRVCATLYPTSVTLGDMTRLDTSPAAARPPPGGAAGLRHMWHHMCQQSVTLCDVPQSDGSPGTTRPPPGAAACLHPL